MDNYYTTKNKFPDFSLIELLLYFEVVFINCSQTKFVAIILVMSVFF